MDWFIDWLIVQDVRKSYQRAMDSMARLNRTASRLMHKVQYSTVQYSIFFSFLIQDNQLKNTQAHSSAVGWFKIS